MSKRSLLALLVSAFSLGNAWTPMEPARKTLIVMAHGINPIQGSLYKSTSDDRKGNPDDYLCNDASGNGHIWRTHGVTQFLEKEVTGTFNHAYAQGFSFANASPVDLAHDLADRTWSITRDCDGEKFTKTLKGGEIANSVVQVTGPQTMKSFFEQATIRWLEGELLKSKSSAGNPDPEIDAWIKAYWSAHGNQDPTLDAMRQSKPALIPSRFIVIVHSMGGLTAREYIHSSFYNGDIDKLITLDSPMQGSYAVDQNQRVIQNGGVDASLKPIGQAAAQVALASALLALPVSPGVQEVTNTLADLIFWGALYGTAGELIAKAAATELLASGYGYNDGANLYLSPGSPQLKWINSLSAPGNPSAPSPYKLPAFRVFHNEGIMSIGDPANFVGDGFALGAVVPKVYQAAFESLVGLGGGYIETDDLQQISNSVLSVMIGAATQINVSQQGTIVVPYWSSWARDVADYNVANADVRRHRFSINGSLIDLSPPTEQIAKIGGYIVTSWLEKKAAYAILDRLATFPTYTYLRWVKPATALAMTSAANWVIDKAIETAVPGANESGVKVPSLLDLGSLQNVAISHDYATIYSVKDRITDQRVAANPQTGVTRQITPTLMEDFLYEKPYVTLNMSRDGAQAVPAIFGSNQAPLLRFPASALQSIDYASVDWQERMAVREESYETVQGTTSTVRRVNRSLMPNELVVSSAPAELRFQVEDLRPDLMEQITFTTNYGFFGLTWDRIADPADANYGKYKVYRWNADGTKTPLPRIDPPPISDKGVWTFKPLDYLETAPPKNENLSVVWRDGQNAVGISMINHAGMQNSQRFFLMFQATEPLISMEWPAPYGVISLSRPELRVQVNALSYPGIDIDPAASWFKIYPRTSSGAEDGSAVPQQTFAIYETLAAGNRRFRHTLTSAQAIPSTGAYWLEVFVASRNNLASAGASRRKIPFTYDGDAPSLTFQLPAQGQNPDLANLHLRFSYQDPPLQSLQLVRAQILNAGGQLVYEAKPMAAVSSGGGDVLWAGKSVGGANSPDGLYTFRVTAKDQAASDAPGSDLSQAVLNLLPAETDGTVSSAFESSWSALTAHGGINATTSSGTFYLDRTKPLFQLVSRIDRVGSADQQRFVFKVADGSAALASQQAKLHWTFTLTGVSGASQEIRLDQQVDLAATSLGSAPSLELKEEQKGLHLADGHYDVSVIVEDPAGNRETFHDNAWSFLVDRTAPHISGMFTDKLVYNSHIPAVSPKLTFQVDEDADAPDNKMTQAQMLAGITAVIRPSSGSPRVLTVARVNATLFETDLPADALSAPGEWAAEVTSTDLAGNSRSEAVSFSVDLRPPRITYPDGTVPISGKLPIYGLAAPITLRENAFLRYELAWRPVGGASWQTAGLTVPLGQRGTSTAQNVSAVSVNIVGLLGYWDVTALAAGTYELQLTVVETGGTQQTAVTQVDVSPAAGNPFTVSLSGLPTGTFVPGPSGLSIGLSIDPGNLDLSLESDLLASKSYSARISMVDASGAVLREVAVSPLKSSVFLGAPSNTAQPGVYLWNLGGAWTLKVNQAPSAYRFLIGYAGTSAMPTTCPTAFACQDNSAKESETDIPGEGKIKVNRQLVIEVSQGISGQATFTLPANATFLPLVASASGGAAPMIDAAIFFAGKYAKRPFYGNQSSGTEPDRVPLMVLHPVPSSYTMEWNGFRPNGSFPQAGTAKVAVDVIEEGSRRVASTAGTFTIGSVPVALTASANPAVLKLEPGSAYSNLTFKYGLFGAPAYLTAYIRNPANPSNPLFTFFTDKLHEDRQAVDAYSVVWNGIDKLNHLVDDQPNLEFVVEARSVPGGPTTAFRTLAFSVELSKWVKATGNAMQLRVLETDPADATYVRAQPKFRLAADLQGTLADTRPFNYDVAYSGTQKVLAYPAKRFDLFVRRHRESFPAQVIGRITTQIAGYRSSIWSGCPNSVVNVRNYFFQQNIYPSRGVEQVIGQEIESYSSSSRDFVFRCLEDRCANDLIHTLSFIIVPYHKFISVTGSNFDVEYEQLKQLEGVYHVDNIQLYDNEVRYPGPAYDKNTDSWINQAGMRSFTSQYFKTDNKPIIFDPQDRTNCPPFDPAQKPGENPRDMNKDGVMNKGDLCLDNTAYDPNKNLVQVRIDYLPGESSFIYHRYDHGTCAPEGHINLGFKLKLIVPDEYWDAPFGYNNMANACMRFDPANKTLYTSDGYFVRDHFDNNNNGTQDDLDPSEKTGEITPFDRQTFRYAPYAITKYGNPFGLPGEYIITNGSGDEGTMLLTNPLSFGKADNAYVNSERWDFGFNGDEKLGASSMYTATISSQSCSNTTGVCPPGSPKTVLATINSVANPWATNPYPLTGFIGLPANFQNLVNYVDKDFKNLVIDVRLKAKPAELFQGALLSQASMVWPAGLSDVDAKNLELGQDAGNPRKIYYGVSGVRYGIGDGLTDNAGVPSQLVPPATGYVDNQGYFLPDVDGNARPAGSNFNKVGNITLPGTLADDGSGNLAFVDAVHFLKFANGNYSWVSSNHGSNVLANTAAITVPAGIAYTPITVGGQNQIRFSGGATRAWSGTEDPHLALHDLDGDGLTGEDALDNLDADGDGVIDEDPKGAVESILSFPAGVASRDYALGTDLYIPSAANPGTSGQSLFQYQGGAWHVNPLVHNLSLQGLSLRYLDGAPMSASDRADLELDPASSSVNVPNPSSFTMHVRRKNGSGRPRELVTLLGTASDKYNLYTLSHDGSLSALNSVPLRKPVAGAERVLGYLDVNQLQGSTSLLLTQESGGQITYQKLDVNIGSKVLAAGTAPQVVSSLYGDAEVFFPVGAISTDIPVTVRITSVSESGLNSKSNLNVIGPVVEVLPSMGFPTGANPQVKISLDRAALGSVDPANVKMYKPDGADLQELSPLRYTFFAAGARVCGEDQNGDNLDGICTAPWDKLVVTGSTSSFSHFILLDKTTAEIRPYTVSISPVSSPELPRELSVTGFDRTAFTMYVDDDPDFHEDNDPVPPVPLAFESIIDETAGGVRGVVRLPNIPNSYITIVPTAANALFKTIQAKVGQPPEINYLGSPAVYLNNQTQLPIDMTFYANDTGTVALELISEGATYLVEGFAAEPPYLGVATLHWDGTVGGNPIPDGKYAVYMNFTNRGGLTKRSPGPQIIVDRTNPLVSLAGAVSSASGATVLKLSGAFSDDAGLSSAHIMVHFDKEVILDADVDPSQPYFQSVPLGDGFSTGCASCVFRGVLTVEDANGNSTSADWVSDPILSMDRRTLIVEGGILNQKLTEFPLPVRVDAKTPWFDFDRAEPDGSDVFFEDDKGQRLHHTISLFDSDAKQALFWVTMPTIAAGRTTPFTMRWSDLAAAQVPAFADSNADYVGVWHFDASDPETDFSGLGNNAVESNVSSVPGLLQEGLSFSGPNSKLTVPTSPSLSITDAFSVSVWVDVASASSLPATPANVIGKGSDWSILLSRDKVVFRVSGESLEAPFSSLGTGGWRLISCAFASGTSSASGARILVDGRLIASGPLHGNQPIVPSTAGLVFGGGSGTTFFNGFMDEVSISRVAHPSDWFRMEYETQAPESRGVRAGVDRMEFPDHYKWITINTSSGGLNLGSDINDFPVKVELDEDRLPGFTSVMTPANIAFADENGNYLPFDIESWEPRNDHAVIWVRLRKFIAGRSDYKFAMLYSENRLLAANNPQAVWNPSFKGVWHFPNALQGQDAATGQAGNLAAGLADQGIAGKGLTISDPSHGLEAPASPSGLNLFPGFTLEGWYFVPSPGQLLGTQARVLSKEKLSGGETYSLGFDKTSNGLAFGIQGQALNGPANSLGYGAWHQLAATLSPSGAAKLYEDGQPIAASSFTLPAGLEWNAKSTWIGRRSDLTLGAGFTGKLDEIRIQQAERDASWIAANYNLQAPDNTRLTFGAEADFDDGIFIPEPPPPPMEVRMRDLASGNPDIVQPEIQIVNNGDLILSDLVLRMSVSREEAPNADVVVDDYGSNPCGARYRVTPDASNPNLVMVDVILPKAFNLAPGQTSSPDALRFGIHFNSASKAGWVKSNDPSFIGIGGTSVPTDKIVIYDRFGNILFGHPTDPSAVTTGPIPPAAATRISLKTRALYYFSEGSGLESEDVSGTSIPLDLRLSGPDAQWMPTGGIAFSASAHTSIVENRTPNTKLFDGSVASGKLTVETWIEPGNLTQSSGRIVDYASGDGVLDRNFGISQIGKNLEFKLRTANNLAVTLATTSNPLATAGARYHVVMTYAPYQSGTGGMRIYVNGSLVAQNTESGALLSSGTNAWNPAYILALGNRPSVKDKPWQGNIRLLAIYATDLTASQVTQNNTAGLRESAFPRSLRPGVACEDRLMPIDIADGIKPWTEDRSASGPALSMGGQGIIKGIGGTPGTSGATTYLLYDLEYERTRLEIPSGNAYLSGFTGRQDGTGVANTMVKVSSSVRQPTDQDWLGNSGSVTQMFSSNGGSNVPLDLDISGAKWLWLGQRSTASAVAPEGVFGNLKIRFEESANVNSPTLSGLEYRYYEGNWTSLPNFPTLSPEQTGIVGDFDLSPRLRNDNFAFEYTGLIRISAAGTYTFFTESDDGSRLYIDGQQVVDNDGVHPQTEKSGSLFLMPGMHSIRVTFFDYTGGEYLKVRYQGPSIPKGVIPSTVLFRPGAGVDLADGRVIHGMRAFYLFRKEPGPSVYDLAGNGLPIDLNVSGNDAVWLEGSGISLVGANHHSILESRAPNAKLFNTATETDELSLEAWLETPNLSQAGYPFVMRYGSLANDDRNFAMMVQTQNLSFALRTANGDNIVLNTTNSPLSVAGMRYHVLMTYSPAIATNPDGGMRIYVNGVLCASNTESGVLKSSGTHAWNPSYILSMGNRPATLDRGWAGNLRLAAIYDRALTSEQVATNFRAGIPTRKDIDAVLFGTQTQDRLLPWDFVGGSSSWTEDASPSGSPISMSSIIHPVGLSGQPGPSGEASWILYDLEKEKQELGLPGSPLRLTGFAGVQDATGTARISIKTSAESSAPDITDWLNNGTGVTERAVVDNGSNFPIDIGLNGDRWVWVGQASQAGSQAPGIGVLGNLKAHFGPETTPDFVSGLAYSYYEGNWTTLPDMDALVPKKTGFVQDVDLTPRMRSDNFGMEFKGFIQIYTPGTYTFYTTSDDGSRLYIDGAQVVNNDGLHGMVEASGTIVLGSGFHTLKLRYFDNTGDDGLKISYQGPSLSKRKVPAGTLFHSDTYGYGINADYFQGSWSTIPEFEDMTPISSDLRSNVFISPRSQNDNFGFDFRASIFVPTAGNYTFFSNSDDGSRILIDGATVVNNDGIHPMTEISGTVPMSEGFHLLRISYFDRTGGEGLNVSMQGPGMAKMPIPTEMLFSTNPSVPVPPTPTGKDAAISLGGQSVDANYTIVGTQWFKVPLLAYANTWASTIYVSLDDMNGVVMQGQFQFENGTPQTLNTWYQYWTTPYTHQNELFFTVTVPSQRLYKVRWWFQ